MILPRRGWWQRLRHSRGFGVHSPSAYRYIREVLRERYAYYAYERIDAYAAAFPGGRSQARMLLRIAIYARPQHAAVAGCADAASRIVAEACPAACLHEAIDPRCRLLVLDGDSFDTEAAMDCARDGATVVLPHCSGGASSELLRRLRSELPAGHTFLNGSGTAVYVPAPAPAQTFAVRF